MPLSWCCHTELPVNHSLVTKYRPLPWKSAIVTFSQRPVVKTTDLFIWRHLQQPGPSVNSACWLSWWVTACVPEVYSPGQFLMGCTFYVLNHTAQTDHLKKKWSAHFSNYFQESQVFTLIYIIKDIPFCLFSVIVSREDCKGSKSHCMPAALTLGGYQGSVFLSRT